MVRPADQNVINVRTLADYFAHPPWCHQYGILVGPVRLLPLHPR
jgi:hypothetical protein